MLRPNVIAGSMVVFCPCRYSPHLADWSSDGTYYAFAAQIAVAVSRPDQGCSVSLLNGHTSRCVVWAGSCCSLITCQCLSPHPQPWRRVTAISFLSGSSQQLVSAGLDKTLRLWDLQSEACIRVLHKLSANISSIAVCG